MSNTLTSFICARLDEEERAAALAGVAIGSGQWDAQGAAVHARFRAWLRMNYGIPDALDDEVTRHVVMHDPARVLAGVAARRRILARHVPARSPGLRRSLRFGCQFDGQDWPCPDVLDLASPYADHPDFDASWAVDSPQ